MTKTALFREWVRAHRLAGPLPAPDFARHFGAPKTPKPPPPPPPPPTPEDPSLKDEAFKEKDRLRKRRGRASTILAGDTLGAGGTLGGGGETA